jgi:hypothetical protein
MSQRPTSQQVNKAGVLPEPTSKPEVTRVVARPVDAPNLRGFDSSLTSLLSGLSQFNEKLSTYVYDQADRDVKEGMKMRADGAPLDGNKGGMIEHGYMVQDGRVTYHAVRLSKPVNMIGGKDEGADPTMRGIQEIQLEQGARFKGARTGERIAVRCSSLWYGNTGHYALPVYCKGAIRIDKQ